MSIEKASITHERDGSEVTAFAGIRLLESFKGPASDHDQPIAEDVLKKTKLALGDFPALAHKTITVGRLPRKDDRLGMAGFCNLLCFYPVDRVTSWVTIYHELAHLEIYVRYARGDDVPITSEEYCGILGVSRMPPDRIDEDRIPYLGYPSAPRNEWPGICHRALEYREDHRDYIQQCKRWLEVDDD